MPRPLVSASLHNTGGGQTPGRGGEGEGEGEGGEGEGEGGGGRGEGGKREGGERGRRRSKREGGRGERGEGDANNGEPLSLSLSLSLTTYLDKSLWIYLVHSVARCTAGLVVKEVTLDKDTVFTEAVDPHLAFILLIKNNT